ncbi:DUF1456 family protein [Solibacillus sp. CAU 1738]|uniref:DUF1456 family protein n=1 Tax=Solibacillus sp. CAU 1738 TaxID=3140363 RepID=UPI0032611D6D
MTTNDMLIRLRYALDIKNVDMVEIFKLGGFEISKEDVLKLLTKPKNEEEEADFYDGENHIKCTNKMLEAFLNGFIIFKRGPQQPKDGQPAGPMPVTGKESPNNMLLKKVKIALSLTSEDMLDLLYEGGVTVSKGELGAILRNPSHKNYKECGDRFARNFLKGLTIKYRG